MQGARMLYFQHQVIDGLSRSELDGAGQRNLAYTRCCDAYAEVKHLHPRAASSLEPDVLPKADGRRGRRPAWRSAQQRRAMPAQLLMFDHRRTPTRPCTPRSQGCVERGEAQMQRVPADQRDPLDGVLVGDEHVVRLQQAMAVEPHFDSAGQSVESKPQCSSDIGCGQFEAGPVPPVFGIKPPGRVVEPPDADGSQHRRDRAGMSCCDPAFGRPMVHFGGCATHAGRRRAEHPTVNDGFTHNGGSVTHCCCHRIDFACSSSASAS